MKKDMKKQVEGKPVKSDLKPVDYAKVASLGNSAKTPKKTGQI